jgi:hypothetical protein
MGAFIASSCMHGPRLSWISFGLETFLDGLFVFQKKKSFSVVRRSTVVTAGDSFELCCATVTAARVVAN